jgi:hypothetical protein
MGPQSLGLFWSILYLEKNKSKDMMVASDTLTRVTLQALLIWDRPHANLKAQSDENTLGFGHAQTITYK